MLIAIGLFIAVLIHSAASDGLTQNHYALWCTAAACTLVHSCVYVFNVPRMTVERYFDINLLSNMIFNAALTLYFFVAVFMFLLLDHVAKTYGAEAFKAFWSVHNVFAILKNLGFALGFYYTGKREIYMTLEQLERIAMELERDENVS
ncbi:MAG TPA: hypothetical protein VGD65_17825 [Chryseosolibacter sp.]